MVLKDPAHEYKNFSTTMMEQKDEWDFSIASMYNPEPVNWYNAYLVNLAHTCQAHLY